jgi:hypothetical protein
VQNVNNKGDIFVPQNTPDFINFYNRENIGYDFGGWSFGLSMIDIDDYDYFMFVNSSSIGPLTKCEKWIDIYTSKLNNDIVLVGSTINKFGYYTSDPYNDSHVQSYAFCLNKIGLNIIINTKIMTLEDLYSDKIKIIQEKEIKMSRDILKAGYNICELNQKNKEIDFRNLTQEDVVLLNTDLQYNKYFTGKIIVPSNVLFVKTTRDINRKFMTL